MRHVRPVIALGLAVLALHCSDATGPSVFDRYLELAPRSVLLFEGDTLRLTAQVFDTLGKKVGQFYWVHEMHCVSENELYTGEAQNWRIQHIMLHPGQKAAK